MRVYRLSRLASGAVLVRAAGQEEAVYTLSELPRVVRLDQGDVGVIERATRSLTLLWQGPDGLYYCDDVYASSLPHLVQVVLAHGGEKRYETTFRAYVARIFRLGSRGVHAATTRGAVARSG